MKVLKRDGTIDIFQIGKIEKALENAFKSCGYETYNEDVIKCVKQNYDTNMDIVVGVEDIQDTVENCLMASHPDVAKHYIIYRYEHKLIRESRDSLTKAISRKLMADNIENQNANVDEFSFGGRMGEAGRVVTKDYALKYCMSRKSRKNHLNNEIYIHDLDSYAVGMHNCYHSNTKFITKNGVVRFGDCCDGQQVEVVDMNGRWKSATVRKYGKQKMYNLTFKCGLTYKTVTCTRNHRWVLENGKFTDNIQIGDKLWKTHEIDTNYIKNEKLWCFGFVIGDGCDYRMYSKDHKKITNMMMNVKLCGDKNKYSNIFLRNGWSIREKNNNNDMVFINRGNGAFKQAFLDNELWKIMSYDDLCNIFEGYIAADGHKKKNGSVMIMTSDERIKKFIEYTASTVGYYLWSQKTAIEDTNYKENRVRYEFYLTKKQTISNWKLVDIKASRNGNNGYMEAWCVEEPTTHTFTLDGGIVTGNCLSIPFDDLLKDGFNTRQTDVRPASSINTAFQLVAVIFQLQSLQQFGGVSATHLDWTMVPYFRLSFYKHFKNGLKYIAKDNEKVEVFSSLDKNLVRDTSINDKMYTDNVDCYNYALDCTIKELEQAVEGMYHNLNTLQSRSGNQLPFTSINYGTCTLPEGRYVIQKLLEGSIKGVGKHHVTPIFPCGIFQLMKGVNRKQGDKNYDLYQLALKSTSQRLYPNYANVDWSGNEGYDKNDPRTYFSTMGCRTSNTFDINGFGQLKDGRGNICPVTIILPTIAMEADRDVEKFMKLLTKKIEEAKDMLLERFEWICKQNPKSASFMWENGTMKGYIPEEGIRSALKHGTLALGQLGLAETLQLLIGKDHTTEEGMDLAIRIETLFNEKCTDYKNKYKLNFGVYYTPAENLCHTALKAFRNTYGIIENVSDREYFTNSIHVPVWKNMNPFEKIDIESKLTGFSSAGCITYVELPSTTKHNIEALETIVNYAMDKDIPYFAINVPNDMCCTCGYTDEFNNECPMCHSKDIKHLRRVTGYLTGSYLTSFNYGKQKEVEDRIKHIKN